MSKVYLIRRSPFAAADGAALSAANQPDLSAVYTGAGRAQPLAQRPDHPPGPDWKRSTTSRCRLVTRTDAGARSAKNRGTSGSATR